MLLIPRFSNVDDTWVEVTFLHPFHVKTARTIRGDSVVILNFSSYFKVFMCKLVFCVPFCLSYTLFCADG